MWTSGSAETPAQSPLTHCVHRACRFSTDPVPGRGQPHPCHPPGRVQAQLRRERQLYAAPVLWEHRLLLVRLPQRHRGPPHQEPRARAARDPGVAASCLSGLGAQVPPSSRPLPFCPPLWSRAALKRRRWRIARPLQSRRPRRRREGSTKPAARYEIRRRRSRREA